MYLVLYKILIFILIHGYILMCITPMWNMYTVPLNVLGQRHPPLRKSELLSIIQLCRYCIIINNNFL